MYEENGGDLNVIMQGLLIIGGFFFIIWWLFGEDKYGNKFRDK